MNSDPLLITWALAFALFAYPLWSSGKLAFKIAGSSSSTLRLALLLLLWVLSHSLAAQLPTSWLRSLYEWVRSFFLPMRWLAAWNLPGEWSQAQDALRQTCRLLLLLALLLTKRSSSAHFNFNAWHQPWKLLLWSGAAVCLSQMLSLLPHWIGASSTLSLLSWGDRFSWQPLFYQLPSGINLLNLLLLSVCQGLLFDRELLSWLGSRLPAPLAYFMTAITFSLAYGIPGYTLTYGTSLALAALGGWLALCYSQTHSLTYRVAVQMLYNGLSFLIVGGW